MKQQQTTTNNKELEKFLAELSKLSNEETKQLHLFILGYEYAIKLNAIRHNALKRDIERIMQQPFGDVLSVVISIINDKKGGKPMI